MRGSNPKAEGRRKPEARRSKAERRPKPEGRNPKVEARIARDLGFRSSDFGTRPSFGLRASGFGLRSQVAPRSGTPLIVRTIRYVLQKMSKLQAARQHHPPGEVVRLLFRQK